MCCKSQTSTEVLQWECVRVCIDVINKAAIAGICSLSVVLVFGVRIEYLSDSSVFKINVTRHQMNKHDNFSSTNKNTLNEFKFKCKILYNISAILMRSQAWTLNQHINWWGMFGICSHSNECVTLEYNISRDICVLQIPVQPILICAGPHVNFTCSSFESTLLINFFVWSCYYNWASIELQFNIIWGIACLTFLPVWLCRPCSEYKGPTHPIV